MCNIVHEGENCIGTLCKKKRIKGCLPESLYCEGSSTIFYKRFSGIVLGKLCCEILVTCRMFFVVICLNLTENMYLCTTKRLLQITLLK